ncbi:MAG: acyl-CoA synthetase [Burkholderiaceae bacterium]|nr:acyl-CoA synthetase [Burkholderiaceae bacterium]
MPQPPIMHPPFTSSFPIRSLADIARIEEMPFVQVLPVRSTYEIACNSAHAFGDRVALTFMHDARPEGQVTSWSFAQLLVGIHQTANALHRLGVQPDDAVGVLLPGCLEYHLALWGGEAAGIVQPLNPLLSEDKLVSLLNAGRAKVLIAYGRDDDAGYWTKAMRIRGRVPTLRSVLRVAPHDEETVSALPPEDVFDFAVLRAAEPDDHLVSGRDIGPQDIAAYFHTGGTTGSPKLACQTHGAQVFTAWAAVQMTRNQPGDVAINGFPLFHVAGVLPGALASLSCGMCNVIPTAGLFRNRDVIVNYWRLVERFKATNLAAVPTVLAALANVPLGEADISSVRNCRAGAAVLPMELAERFERVTGLHVHEGWGMTETTGLATMTPPGMVLPVGGVGLPLPYSRVRVVALNARGDATERDLPTGEVGMILYKAPNVFSGYLDAKDNASAFVGNGWLVTGDLGRLDEEGRLHLNGRAKDLIIRSGHNIDPKVIEDVLSAHPAVHLAAAVGAPDAYAGELPVAFVTLVAGASVSEAELLAFTAEHVDETPARPRSVVVLDAMPLTTVGKIYKPQLQQLAAHAVVDRLAKQVSDELNLEAEARPRVHDIDQRRFELLLDPIALGSRLAPLREQLQAALAPLPLKTEIRVA